MEIFQGDASLASENIFIRNFWIKGLSKARAGNLILLNLELDVNGILKVRIISSIEDPLVIRVILKHLGGAMADKGKAAAKKSHSMGT